MSSFQIIKNSPRNIVFLVKDIDVSIINSMRRIILSEIPNAAIWYDSMDPRDFKIHKNTGVLHNEFLAHRISLIPLHFSRQQIEDKSAERFKFVLKIQNKTMFPLNVTTEHIDIFEGDRKLTKEERDSILPPDSITGDFILITKLKPNIVNEINGDELDIEFKPTIDNALTHARWCPVSKCVFYNVVNQDEVKVHPKRDDRDFQTIEKYRLYKKNKYGEPNEFEFTIDSECKLEPVYLVWKSLDILKDHVQTFISKLKYNTEYAQINKIGSMDDMFMMIIHNESYTLIDSLQSFIFNTEIRDKTSNIISYIGYHQPHPLEDIFQIKMKFTNNMTPETIKTFLVQSAQNFVMHLDKLINLWNKTEKP